LSAEEHGSPKPQIHELSSLSFIERAENVVFPGPFGASQMQTLVQEKHKTTATSLSTAHFRPETPALDCQAR